jgi:hypothetical protein
MDIVESVAGHITNPKDGVTGFHKIVALVEDESVPVLWVSTQKGVVQLSKIVGNTIIFIQGFQVKTIGFHQRITVFPKRDLVSGNFDHVQVTGLS